MTVQNDIRLKLQLEEKLKPELRKYHNALLREFTRLYARAGLVPDTRALDEQLAEVLNKHYLSAHVKFMGRIASEMPPEAAMTQQERDEMNVALLPWYKRRSMENARIINNTTEDDMRSSIQGALDSQKPDQPALTRLETALLAGGIMHRLLIGREESIAVTETQGAVESVKATEAEILLGLNPSVAGGDPKTATAMKTWWAVADNRTRDAHLEADGQQVPASEPFVVDGEELMYPGDTSLGASPGNVINCRCSASYDTADIARQRMEE